MTRTPLVGRGDRVAELAAVLSESVHGGARPLVVVAGEPLVGKTRFVSEACGNAELTCVWGRARLADHHQAHAARQRWSAVAGGERTLVVDDAHHMDLESLEVLLADDHDFAAVVLIVGSSMATRPPRIRALMDEARALAAADVSLEPITEAATLDLAMQVGGLDEVAAAMFPVLAGGLPGVVLPLARAVAEGLTLPSVDELADPRMWRFPPAVGAVVAATVDDIGPEELAAALSLSVVLPASYDTLALQEIMGNAQGVDDRAAERLIDTLVLERLLTHSGTRLAFRRSPIQAALYGSVGPLVRSRLHRRCVEDLRRLRAGDDPVGRDCAYATHALLGGTLPTEEMADAAIRAAEEALYEAPSDALVWYGRAEALLTEDRRRRAAIVAQRAAVLVTVNRVDEAISCAAEVMADANPGSEARARAACALMRALTVAGRPADAVRVGVEAVRIPMIDSTAVAVYQAAALEQSGRLREAVEAATDALRGLNPGSEIHAGALGCRAHAQLLLGDVRGYRSDIAGAIAGCRPGGAQRASLLVQSSWYLAAAGEHAWARALIDRAMPIVDAFGPTAAGDSLLAAERLAAFWVGAACEVDPVAASGDRLWDLSLAAVAAARAVDSGNAEAARRLLRALVPRLEPDSLIAAFCAWVQARLLRLTGDAIGALDLAREAVRRHWDERGLVVVGCLCVTEMAELAVECGRPDIAREAAERLGAAARRSSLSMVGALADHARLLANADQQAGRQAVQRFDAMRTPLLAAQALLAIGRACSDPETLRDAHERFGVLGADPWRRRAAAELRRLGSPVPRQRRAEAPGAALTGLVRDVARLAASGLTNPEIAAVLSMSLGTVRAYLSSVYRKLGVRSRTALAALEGSTLTLADRR